MNLKILFERKQFCSAVFLDLTQSFDNFWHEGLWKRQRYLAHNMFYLKTILLRKFIIKQNSVSDQHPINLIFTSNMPANNNATISTFANDTSILGSHSDPNMPTKSVQDHLCGIQNWVNFWRIQRTHLTFTSRKDTCPDSQTNVKTLLQCSDTKSNNDQKPLKVQYPTLKILTLKYINKGTISQIFKLFTLICF